MYKFNGMCQCGKYRLPFCDCAIMPLIGKLKKEGYDEAFIASRVKVVEDLIRTGQLKKEFQ